MAEVTIVSPMRHRRPASSQSRYLLMAVAFVFLVA